MTYAELCQELRRNTGLLVARYIDPEGSHFDNDRRFFCRSPLRYDRHVGSFLINTRGARQGTYFDFATHDSGDMMDLIKAMEHVDSRGAAEIARQILGIVGETPEQAERRRAAQTRHAEKIAAEKARDEEKRVRRCKMAQAAWLEAEADVRGTPVDLYLAGRGIDLSRLDRWPSAIRFAPSLYYSHIDKETGEFIERDMPAMVTAITRRGEFVGMHRTYLKFYHGQGWRKASVPKPKKVLGSHKGGAIHIWTGVGPRGGKAARLAECAPGTRVYVCEGIEDALSGVMLRPQYRWVAAISLANMGAIELPENVHQVVLCADNDPGEEAQQQLLGAQEIHQRKGRAVMVWRNTLGGKDLNDALCQQQTGGGDHAAA